MAQFLVVMISKSIVKLGKLISSMSLKFCNSLKTIACFWSNLNVILGCKRWNTWVILWVVMDSMWIPTRFKPCRPDLAPKPWRAFGSYRLLPVVYLQLWENCWPFDQFAKKNAFAWNEAANKTFLTLKDAICLTPVLVVELDVVLTQEGGPLAFTSEQLCDRNLGKSTYGKEMMVILHAVNTWQPYLLRHRFQIKIGHHNLK